MNDITDIPLWALGAGYGLLIVPFAIILWQRVPMLGRTAVAVLRMTVQLLFVGLYLQVVFELDLWWLNAAWVLVMIGVADISIVRGARLKLRRFALPVFFSLLAGTAVPLAVFLWVILRLDSPLTAQYVIPIGGMILGNCLRADIVGMRTFYSGLRDREKAYLHSLAQGARHHEALHPFLRDAIEAALSPTVATMTTIGLVALPGMMTGTILAGADPATAIKYQIAIMVAIFSGTAITVLLALKLTARTGFNACGVLQRDVFAGN